MNLPYSRIELLPRYFLTNLITITGNSAAGTSKLQETLSERLPAWKCRSVGDSMRAVANSEGFPSIGAFIAYLREHPDNHYDELIDQQTAKFGEDPPAIIEGRLSHVFAPRAFHVLLTCPLQVRAERRFKQARQSNQPFKSLEEASSELVARDQNDRERYNELYPGYDWSDGDFDIVLNSDRTDADSLCSLLLHAHQEWVNEYIPNRALVR